MFSLYNRNKTRYRQSVKRIENWGISYIVSKCYELWSTNGVKLDRSFYSLSVNSACYFIASLHTRRSAKELSQTLSNGRKYIALTICRRNVLSKIIRRWTNFFIHLIVSLRRLRDLMVNIFGMKLDIDDRVSALHWKL